MAFSVFGLGVVEIALIVGVVLLISFIFFRRYFKALIWDVIEGVGSFADLLIATIPLGDFVVALFIYKNTKKTLGKWVIFPVLEALNFIVGLIPVVGQPIEFVTNLFPGVFVTTLVSNMYGKVMKKKDKLEGLVSIAEQVGLKDSHEKKVLKQVKKLIRKSDYVDALKESKKPIEELSSEIREYVDNLISETEGIIQYIEQQNVNAPQYLKNILIDGINNTGQLLKAAEQAENGEEPDFYAAVDSAMKAKQVIINAAQEFDKEFQAELQNQVQGGQVQEGYA
jgi:hypothetical protein